MADKTFNKKEIKQILSKAHEIQNNWDIHGRKDDLTIDELAEIASEIGISKSALEQAMQSQETPELGSTFNWLTGTGRIQTTFFINRPISRDDLELILADLNNITGQKGHIEQVGTAFDWEMNESEILDLRRITFQPGPTDTKITHMVSWNEVRLYGLGLAAFFGAIACIILGKSFGLPKSTFMMLSPLGALGGFSIFMMGLNHYYNKQRSKMKRISSAISKALSKNRSQAITIDEEQPSLDSSDIQAAKKVNN